MAAGLRKTLAALEDPSGGRLVYSYFKCLKISKYEKGNEKLEAPGRDRLWRERGAARRETPRVGGRRRGSGGRRRLLCDGVCGPEVPGLFTAGFYVRNATESLMTSGARGHLGTAHET